MYIKRFFLLLFIIFFGTFFRFYKLEDFPIQLSHDEVTQFYDAISIAQTGRDIYGNFMPFIFKSINDFKGPFYTYITIPFYLIYGDREITIRLPGAFFGTFMIPAVFIFVLKLLKNWNIALISAFFTSIAPFEIFFSRKSFESGAGIFLMLIGFSCLLHFIDNKTSTRWLYFAAVFFAMALYTYFSHAIIVPLLLFSFILIFKKQIGISKKIVIPTILFTVLCLPLIFLILTSPETRFRSQDVFITKDINLQKLIEYDESSRNKKILDFSFNRYLDQFNPVFLFGNGLDLTNQGLLGVGPFLAVQLPFLLLGLVFIIKNKSFIQKGWFMFSWIILGTIPSGLTFEVHSPHRMLMVFTMLNIFCAIGAYSFLKIAKKPIIIISGVLFIINFIYFLHIYFVNSPYEKSQHMHYPYAQVMQFAWSQYPKYDHIIIDSKFGQHEIVRGAGLQYFLAYYGHVDPEKIQKELKIDKSGISFDKFLIKHIDWQTEKFLENSLIIASPWSVSLSSINKSDLLRIFTFYDKHPAFYAIKYKHD